MMMNDIIVDLNLTSPEEDAFLSTVLDSFVAQQLNDNHASGDGPEMMVRTAFTPNGDIRKKVIFQSPRWAEAFMAYWESQKMQANAA